MNSENLLGHLDIPEGQIKVYSPEIEVYGWALSKNEMPVHIDIFVDDVLVGTVEERTIERKDVENDFPEIKNSRKSGFYYLLDLSGFEDGIHIIKAIAKSQDRKELGEFEFQLVTSEFEKYQDKAKSKAVKRWQTSYPDKYLTWGKIIDGDSFVELAFKHLEFTNEKNILELGSGYGRILSSILKKKVPFDKFTGIDASPNNVKVLCEKFENPKINFVNGLFSEVQLKNEYDIVLSSLTLKHQYPTFYESLKNISKFVKTGGKLFFDLIENKGKSPGRENLDTLLHLGPEKKTWSESMSQSDRTPWKMGSDTYIGEYTRNEISQILEKIPLKLLSYDTVIHDPESGGRIVVIAQKIE